MISRISSPYLSHLDLPKPLTVREFLTGGRGEVGYGQEGFLVEDDVGGDVVFLVLFPSPVDQCLYQFRMGAAGVGV